MYISQIYASGFRCFGSDAPLEINFRQGLNILVGPNDAGKTAIIDAPRYVLWTRGDDYIRLEPGDFHVDKNGTRTAELLIRCTFDNLKPDEEARFLEWCSNENGTLRLHVCLRAALRQMPGGVLAPISQHRAGKNADGLPLEGDLREYLKATYLRPLRDAERELRSGRRSRLSRILGAMPLMAEQSQKAPDGQPKTLLDTIATADDSVKGNPAIIKVQTAVNTTFLDKLSFTDDPLTATLDLGSKGSFDQILERLELYLNPRNGTDRIGRGLGYNNLLFVAAELLLLQTHPEQIPFLLIEEPEAHLHPQHQSLFMQVLAARAAAPTQDDQAKGFQQVQILLSTHSPQLAASADLETITVVVDHNIYPLAKGRTKLEDDDYDFLHRFLDATKANLFFARGLLIVEGDAENILLPAIAEKLNNPLSRCGVSIVNVGHRGLFRYSRIFQRVDDRALPVPVALIPDRDIPPKAAKALVGDRKTEDELTSEDMASRIAALRSDDGGCVKAFPSEQWTLEFDLARKPGLALLVHQSVMLAKSKAKRTPETINIIKNAAESEYLTWKDDGAKTDDDIATLIFGPLFKKSVSKAQVAEQLAQLIIDSPDTAEVFRTKLPTYLLDAIDYVTARPQSSASASNMQSSSAQPTSGMK